MSRISKQTSKRKSSLSYYRNSDSVENGVRKTIRFWLQKHGVRILLVIGLALVIRLFFPLATVPEFPEFEVGMVAVRESTFTRIDRFFGELDSTLSGMTPEEGAERISWLKKEGLEVTVDELVYLQAADKRLLLNRRLKNFISGHLNEGILTDDSMAEIQGELVTIVQDGKELIVRTERLVSLSQVFRRSWEEEIDSSQPEISQSIFLDLINRFLKPNVVYNELETRRRIVLAEAEVSPIKGQVLEGEKIIEKGYRIRAEDLEKFHALREEMLAAEPTSSAFNNAIFILGTFLVNIFLLMIFGLYLYFYRQQLYDSIPSLISFAIIFLFVMLPAALVARVSAIPSILIPISLASLLLAILHDVRIAVVATLVLSILIGGQESFGYEVLFLSLMGGISGGLSIRIIRKRRQLGESILYIAGGYILGAISIGMIRLTPWIDTVELCGWGGINAVLSALLAMALLPAFEFVFNQTTDLTLMELSDFNHPLLRSLVIRAPGTWAHTLGVSNLAEAAAEAIGANSLLARVGCYYHDIGKIKKPEYFIENQSTGTNPHDGVSPKMSAMIIENHVKEGIELAREAKIPQILIDFIPEHHGTQKISFFYEKARGETNDDRTISVHDYSYQGPKPQSKETAICMLADSVESISRTLSDPSPSRIRGMVRSAIKAKVEAEQLEECDLTFRDLHRIEESFVKILLARFHSRIEYLQEEGKKDDEKKEEPVGHDSRQSGAADRTSP
jgi:putative nucleotidyltransferase with HDIG domain